MWKRSATTVCLAFSFHLHDIKTMSKTGKKRGAGSRVAGPRPASKKPGRGYEIVGTTSDGVKILRPKMKATHFTSAEIREAINEVKKRISVRS